VEYLGSSFLDGAPRELMLRLAVFVTLAAWAGLGCSSRVPVIAACEPGSGLEPICGLTNPEDFAVLPGGDWIAVSRMAVTSNRAGSLAALRVADDVFVQLYPAAETAAGVDADVPTTGWGDPACPGPPDPERFAPHGIDTVARADGVRMLLAVNHGVREAVELFEVGSSGARPTLGWRGCVVTPPDAAGNDVAATRDGRFVVTNMAASSHWLGAWLSGVRMALGLDTGRVLEWTRESGWQIVGGSAASGPNGGAVNADGSAVYLAAYGSRELIRVARGEGASVRAVEVPFRPDNITWTPAGSLLVTGQATSMRQLLACYALESGSCALPFGVVVVDPETLAVEVILEHDGRTVIGAATVALRHGERLYLGTFRGDRAARTRADPRSR